MMSTGEQQQPQQQQQQQVHQEQQQPQQQQQHVVKLAKRRADWAPGELPSLGLTDLAALNPGRDLSSRLPCSSCGRSRAMYCYDCAVPLIAIPPLHLPFRTSIITHPDEPPSKNTGVHAKVLAPSQVDLHSLDDVPAFDPARSLVLFPSDDAITVDELDAQPIDRVFIIDSKWKKAETLSRHPVLTGVRHVKLTDQRSAFWRYHTSGVGEEGVCTIECLYYLLKTMQAHGKLAPAPGQAAAAAAAAGGVEPDVPRSQGGGHSYGPHAFDDLLVLFSMQRHIVEEAAAKRLDARQQGGGGERGQQHGQESPGAGEVGQHGGRQQQQQGKRQRKVQYRMDGNLK